MPDKLYRRCPACLASEPDVPCPLCYGEGFVPSGITLRDVTALSEKVREAQRLTSLMTSRMESARRGHRKGSKAAGHREASDHAGPP